MRITIILLVSLSSLNGFGQSEKLTVRQAIDSALKNNLAVQTAALDIEAQEQMNKTYFDLPKTIFLVTQGQYNSYAKNDRNLTIAQNIPIAALGSQALLRKSLLASSEVKKVQTENDLAYQVKQVYYQLVFMRSRHALLLQQDSIYEGFLKSANLRYKTGETRLLEQTTAETQRNEVKNQLRQNDATINILRTQLKTLLNSEFLPDVSDSTLDEIPFDPSQDTALSDNPFLAYLRQQVEVARGQKRVEGAKYLPDLMLGYFRQTLINTVNPETGTLSTSQDRFSGFQVGLAIPLWFFPYHGRWKAAEVEHRAAQSNYENQKRVVRGKWEQAVELYARNKNSLEYYRSSALPNADLILKQSHAAFRGGEIGYAEYLLGLRNAIGIREGYWQTLNEYNQSILYIEYLTGIK